MPPPIRLQYDGHVTPIELPLWADASYARNWWMALAHVNRFIAPHRPSFTLFDDRFRVRYNEGVPDAHHLRTLLSALREVPAEVYAETL